MMLPLIAVIVAAQVCGPEQCEALCAVDTDNDGLSDATEAALGTNPDLVDTDGDGLTDLIEVVTRTDPTSIDTDGDGFCDGPRIVGACTGLEDLNADGANQPDESDPRCVDTLEGLNGERVGGSRLSCASAGPAHSLWLFLALLRRRRPPCLRLRRR